MNPQLGVYLTFFALMSPVAIYAIARMVWHHRHLQRCQRARIHTHELSSQARADIQTCIAEVHAGAAPWGIA